MRVYLYGKLIVIETNVAWALPYWVERKRLNKNITWLSRDNRNNKGE